MRRDTLTFAILIAATSGTAAAVDIENWPTKVTTASGTEFALTGNFAYDANEFSGDDRLEDREFMRRKEFGFTVKKKGTYDAMVYFDFQSKLWLDVYYRFETKPLFGTDLGRVRVGYMKTPVGLDGVTSARAGTFLEVALPAQAIYAGRRTGAEWVLERPRYLLQAGAYGGTDLQGDNPGTTQAVRGVWTPVKAAGDVLHFGVAYSTEQPRGYRDGRDVAFPPSARIRARPEAGLTDVRQVDSGTLVDVDRIQRLGLEQLWIHGPFSVQSEALQMRVSRDGGLPDFDANGQYVFGSWVLTGESREYGNGLPSNVKPRHDYGAVELALRYSRLDLDDGSALGGRQRDWTLGANWYLTSHFKFQANYARIDATRGGVTTHPDAFELRAQVQF